MGLPILNMDGYLLKQIKAETARATAADASLQSQINQISSAGAITQLPPCNNAYVFNGENIKGWIALPRQDKDLNAVVLGTTCYKYGDSIPVTIPAEYAGKSICTLNVFGFGGRYGAEACIETQSVYIDRTYGDTHTFDDFRAANVSFSRVVTDSLTPRDLYTPIFLLPYAGEGFDVTVYLRYSQIIQQLGEVTGSFSITSGLAVIPYVKKIIEE